MDTITKWKINDSLDIKEACEILEELYQGAQKKIHINSAPINPILFNLFTNFNTRKDESKLVLNFSETICEKPFISLKLFEELKPKHQIKLQEHTIYIYE